MISPDCFPFNKGAPSVVMLTSLSRHSCDFSRECITPSNISCPVAVPLRLSMDSNSVMQKCSSIPLIKISNCAVSNISVLSSKAIEKHLNVFAVFNRFACKLAAMAYILRTVVFLDMGIASIFDFTSEHTILIASTMQSFTNSASEKGLLPFAILCAKTKLAFVATSCVDENLSTLLVRCCCFSFLTISAALIFSSCVENCWPKSLCFTTKCRLILYSLNTAHVSLQIQQAAFE